MMQTKHLMISAVVGTVALAVAVPFSCYPPGTPRPVVTTIHSEPTIRVALVRAGDAGGLLVEVAGPCAVRAFPSQKPLANLVSLPAESVTSTADGISLGSAGEWPVSQVLILPQLSGSLAVNGTRYRGQLLLAKEGELLSAVNVLPLDEYLAGVLGSEVVLSWPTAALQAQAIAARTYALFKMEQNKGNTASVASDSTDQNYRGMERETERARDIVAQTRGVVLTYRSDILPAYYCAACGGHTVDVTTGLEKPTIPPLSGVECGFCQDSPYYQWDAKFTKNDISEGLNKAGYAVTSVAGIQLLGLGPHGHASSVQVQLPRGQRTLKASEFRFLMGGSKIRSTRFTVEADGGGFTFRGQGWGHGVGLCQWGAKGMAGQGYAAEMILSHYYPGTKLEKVY
jgi:stage II sporulation protein D